MITFYTTDNANLRSEPKIPSRSQPTNIIATIPTHHWFVASKVVGDWVSGTTIFAGRTLAGFIHTSLLKVNNIEEEPPVTPEAGSPGIIRRHDVFYEDAAERLRPYLTINPPQEAAQPQESVAFKRSRNIEVDWSYILLGPIVEEYTGQALPQPFAVGSTFLHFRRYFERLWGIDGTTYPALATKIFLTGDVKVPRVIQTVGGVGLTYVMELRSGITVLKHPLTQRMFELTLDVPLTAADFADYAAYRAIWPRVTGIEYCFPSSEADDAAPRILTTYEEVDLAPSIIVRQYREFEDLRQFATDLSARAEELAKQQVTGLLSELQINYLLNAIMRMKQPLRDLEFGLRRLADKASDLNYLLPLADQTFTYPDGSTLPIVKGKLYRPYRTQITWSTNVVRTRDVWVEEKFLGVVISRRKIHQTWTERIQQYANVEKYGEVQVDLDPWEEKELALGHLEGLVSYRFERVGGEYVTATGIELTDIMERCEQDEAFRRTVAIWIPSYEQKLTSGEVLTRYAIFKRPFPGYTPVRSPAMFVHETLSYRTGWRTSELGELVHSVNMAPGEERTITIEQSTTRQVEDIQSTTSILDLTESESMELSDEIEKEASSSNESTRTNSLSASAGGSYGPFSGSVSGSTSSTQTAKQFARQLERVARKAARNMTRKSTQEVRSSTTVKTNVSRSESTSINVKNINEGRTLNILFYRLYNIFTASLIVENLQLVVIPSTEVVHGSGVTVPRVYDFARLDQAFSAFDFNQLGYESVPAVGTAAYKNLFVAYWSYLIDQFINLLGKEYDISTGEESASVLHFAGAPNALLAAIQAGKHPRLTPASESIEDLYKSLRAALSDIIAELDEAVQQANENGEAKPLIQHDLRVASPGLYVDAMLGVSPATEPYAEEMRAQKVMSEAAEVARQFAVVDYYRSLAGTLATNQPSGPSVVHARRESNRKIILDLGKWYKKGRWALFVDAAKIREFDVAQDALTPIPLSWDSDMAWISDSENHVISVQIDNLRLLVSLAPIG